MRFRKRSQFLLGLGQLVSPFLADLLRAASTLHYSQGLLPSHLVLADQISCNHSCCLSASSLAMHQHVHPNTMRIIDEINSMREVRPNRIVIIMRGKSHMLLDIIQFINPLV